MNNSIRVGRLVSLLVVIAVLWSCSLSCLTWAQLLPVDPKLVQVETKPTLLTVISNTTGAIPASTIAAVNTALTSAINNVSDVSDEVKRFQKFKNSIYYLPPFEPEVLSLPEKQIAFIKEVAPRDFELFRAILREAIDKRNSFAPSMSLMLKYSVKLLTMLIRNRREEMKIVPRVEPKPAFWEMLAGLAETVLAKSVVVRKEKGYTKRNIDTVELYTRFDAILKYIARLLDVSPVGAYLKWNEMVLFKGESQLQPEKDLIEEASDMTAQFRAMGYDGCTFVAKRIVNLLRIFARGKVPSIKDV